MKDVSGVIALKKDISKVLYDKFEECAKESGMSVDSFYFQEIEVKVTNRDIEFGIGLTVKFKEGE